MSIKNTSQEVNEIFKRDALMMMMGATANLEMEGETFIRIHKDNGKVDWEFETRESISENNQ